MKIGGVRGRWVAEVEGQWLAVLHHLHRVGPNGYRAEIDQDHIQSKRFQELVNALEQHDLVVIQRDRDRETLARDGYVGVFRFTDLKIDYEALELTLQLTERYADPT